MSVRFTAVVLLLASLALAALACAGREAEPTPGLLPTSGGASLAASAPEPAATGAQAQSPTPTPAPPLLVKETPPCVPVEGSAVDPCGPESGAVAVGGAETEGYGDAPRTVYDFLTDEYGLFTTHVVARGTYVPGTVRCEKHLGYRSPSYQDFSRHYHKTDGPDGILTVLCYSDVRVGEYILGSGPATLSVVVAAHNFFNHTTPAQKVDGWLRRMEWRLMSGGEGYPFNAPEGGIGGRESVLFLAPVLSTVAEAWMVAYTWNVERQDDETVIVVHPYRRYWRDWSGEWETHKAEIGVPLAAFKAKVAAAHQTRMTEYGGRVGEGANDPVVRTNTNDLHLFLRDVGAYTMEGGPPTQPPKPYAPAPATLTATATGAGETTLTWAAVTHATTYRVEHRLQGADDWEFLAETPGRTTHTTDRLYCGRAYEFRVGAFGNGTVYSPAPRFWSPTASVTAAACGGHAPVFYGDPFAFDVSVAAVVGDVVGRATAIDINADPISYSITGGSGTGKFAVDRATGEIAVAATLAASVGNAYTLDLTAADGITGSDTATVTITVVAPDCTSGGAVEDVANTGLTADCTALLTGRNTLAGTATLNWSESLPMTAWDGVTLRGSPSRVTRLNLERKGLTGSVPPELGELAGLITLDLSYNRLTGGIPPELGTLGSLWNLDLSSNRLTGGIPPELGSLPGLAFLILSDNRLTGEIPAELGDLPDPAYLWLNDNQLSGGIPPELGNLTRLAHLWLSGNRLSGTIPSELSRLANLTLLVLGDNLLVGCVPPGLGNIRTNDIDGLGLADCQEGPPAPTGLDASLTDDAFSLSWTALTGADKYEAQHRITGSDNPWETLPETTVASATHTPAGGPVCSSAYEFRVRAHGDGFTYPTHWGPESTVASVDTLSCPPEFGQDAYTFKVGEDAAVDDAVGAVSATDPDEDDTVTYSITAGNTGNAFAIGGGTGAITVAGALDHETAPSYTLTVEASDGQGGEDTAMVTVTVTDVAEDAPPAPTGLTATLAGGTFSLSWTAVTGAAKYEAQHRTGAADSQWTALPETAGLSAAYAPEGGPECSAEYQFRVRAYGDGDAYTEMWGVESGVETVETATCDPEFGQDPYAFEVAENAAVGDPVGTVSATDPDEDTLTYSITAGNTGNAFAIGGGTGAITVAGALDHETAPSYTLTVEASDGQGGEDTATVTVTVSDVAEDAPPAPTGLTATLAGGTFSLSWTAVTGAAKYEAQHRTGAADSQWTALPETAGLSAAYAPEGGPECSSRVPIPGAGLRGRRRLHGDVGSGVRRDAGGDCHLRPGVRPVPLFLLHPGYGGDRQRRGQRVRHGPGHGRHGLATRLRRGTMTGSSPSMARREG